MFRCDSIELDPKSVLVELVPTFSPGLNVPRSNCIQHPPMHSCCSCYALVVKLLLLGEGIVGKFNKRKNRQTQTDRRILATLALWNVVNLPLLVGCAAYMPAATQGERDRRRQ